MPIRMIIMKVTPFLNAEHTICNIRAGVKQYPSSAAKERPEKVSVDSRLLSVDINDPPASG